MKIPNTKGLAALVIGLPENHGEEIHLNVEVLPDTFDTLTRGDKAVVNTPAGLGESFSVAMPDYTNTMVFWKNANGSIDPLYMSICPYCPQEK